MTDKIQKFTPKVCDVLGTEIESALQAIAEKYGVQIKRGRGSYTASNFTMKVEVATVGEGGQAQTREYDALVQMLPVLDVGVSVADLGATFTHPRAPGPFKIVGYRTRAPKKPFILEVEGGRQLVAGEGFIKGATKLAA